MIALPIAAAIAAGQLLPAVSGIPWITHLLAREPHSAGITLTFDDGPHPEGTPRVLDLLKEYQAHATFFVLGEQLERYPAIGRRMAYEGHELAVHGWNHQCVVTISSGNLERDLVRTCALIDAVSGQRPTRYRPPYGVFSASAWWACHRVGLRPTWWTRWGRDWSARATPTGVVRRIGCLDSDAVVLLHDSNTYGRGSWRTAPAALEIMLTQWSASGIDVHSLDAVSASPMPSDEHRYDAFPSATNGRSRR